VREVDVEEVQFLVGVEDAVGSDGEEGVAEFRGREVRGGGFMDAD
jgi:hypothetical protein